MNRNPRQAKNETRIQKPGQDNGSGSANGGPNIIRTLSESFQQLADRSQDAIYLFDIESGTFPFFNKRFLELFAGEKDGHAVLSNSVAAQRIHPDDIKTLKTARRQTLESGGSQGEVEYRYLGFDGTTRWMQDRWTVVRDTRNKAVAIEGFIRDNTLKRQAEDELEHSRNSALIGSYILQKRRFKYVNPEFCRIAGYSNEELIGMPSLDLVHPDCRDQVKENAVQMLTGQRSTPYEFRIKDKSGTVKWVMETVTAVKHGGSRAVLGYFMDITQQKQIAKEHRDKEKLRAILEMAGAVSHELNNPLQVVLVAIEKLGNADLEPNQRKKLIRLVKKHTLRITELSSKIQRISQYATKDYVDGKKIFDIDGATEK